MRVMRVAKRIVSQLAEQTSTGRTYLLMRDAEVAQPKHPVAKVVFSALTEGGANANGKVSAKQFIPPFCDELRRNGFRTEFAWSKKELSRRLSGDLPTVLIQLYGEDNVQILDEEIQRIEGMAAATFNRAELGPLLADKLATQTAFLKAELPVPPVIEQGGHVRRRLGSKKSTELGGNIPIGEKQDDFIRTKFIDTRMTFKDKTYYTTIRLLCLDDIILHAFPRARDVDEGDADVHARNTPLDAELIEHLHEKLVQPYEREFTSIAGKLADVFGHGFFAHDLLVEGQNIFICESGFKLDDLNFSKHLEPIANQIPSQAPLFPIEDFSRRSAKAFIAKCESVLHSKQ